MNKNKPIIITQENYLGQNYDLLILMPMPFISAYNAYFIQIGTNKTKAQIDTIKKDLNENESNYKIGIKTLTDCDINNVYLTFIFDKDTQIGLINKDEFSRAQYCINNNILFFLFSIEDFKLYYSNDMDVFIPEDKKKKKKVNKRLYNKWKGDFLFLTIEEIQLINGLIKDDILNNYYVSNEIKNKNIENLNKYDKNSIYICYNKNNRIFIINQKYYQLIDGELKNVAKKYINQKEDYQMKKLRKIYSSKRNNKKLKNK